MYIVMAVDPPSHVGPLTSCDSSPNLMGSKLVKISNWNGTFSYQTQLLLLLLLLLKPAAQAQVGKENSFINCFHEPTSTCATENRKNTTQRSNQ